MSESPSQKRKLFYIIILFGFFVTFLIILEFSLRLIRPQLKHYIHVPYDVTHNLGYTGGHPFSYNKWGLREIDFDLEKPPGQLRILCIGDSITFGYGLAAQAAWPKRLQGRLAQLFPNQSVFCINAGGVASSTHDQLRFYETQGRRFGANLVVVGFCLNDVEPKDYQMAPRVSTGAKLQKFMEFRFRFRRSYLFTALDITLTDGYRHYIWPWVTGKNPLAIGEYRLNCFGITPGAEQAWDDTLTALGTFNQKCGENRAVLAVAAFPYHFMIGDDPRDNPYKIDKSSFKIDPVKKLGDFCRARQIVFIDLTRDYVSSRQQMRRGEAAWDPLFFDYCHPTALGQDIAARAIMKGISPIVNDFK